jgi:predicted nucleotidyltransferase
MTITRIKIPQKKIAEYCQKNQIKRMAFFGSVLREDFSPESDLDILVVFEPTAKVSFITLGKMKRELSKIFNRPIDLVPQDGLKPAIRESVLSSAMEVYAS